MRYAILFPLFAVLYGAAPAQDLVVYGVVKCADTRVPLPGAMVELWRDGAPLGTLESDSTGRYEVIFGLGPVYRLRFGAVGRVAKVVQIDTGGIPEAEAIGGFGMNVDMTLFEHLPGADLAFLEEPMGLARYIPEQGNLVWDQEHTQRIRDMIEATRNDARDR